MSFIYLFISGIVVYVVLRFLLGGLIDNRVKIDPEKERKLTEGM